MRTSFIPLVVCAALVGGLAGCNDPATNEQLTQERAEANLNQTVADLKKLGRTWKVSDRGLLACGGCVKGGHPDKAPPPPPPPSAHDRQEFENGLAVARIAFEAGQRGEALKTEPLADN